MQKHAAAMLAAIPTILLATGLTAQAPRMGDVQSTFDMAEGPVLKVYSAEEDGHRFVAYLVKWKNAEVIVSDPLGQSQFKQGDKINFIAQKISLPESPAQVLILNFNLIDVQPPADAGTDPDGESVAPAEHKRQMKLVQGDLDAAKTGEERFYALNKAARNAWQKGDTAKARALATELAELAPKHKNNWNYGNAVQDANQVLGLIALDAGNVAEAKQRLLASADSQGSPQMNSFGPNMQLAKALLEQGERDVVLEYFSRCGAFWEMGKSQLAAWTAAVQHGQIPAFGANLNY